MKPAPRACSSFSKAIVALALLALLAPRSAHALPGFFAGKKSEPVTSHSTQIALMKKGSDTVISVMPDYEGPLEPFALVLMVPADVSEDGVTTLKRDFLDRLDALSAPRFHEYWEQDPCDPGPVEQEWERNLKVQGAAGGPLGGGAPAPEAGAPKSAKELFLDVTAKQKAGEYRFTLLEPGADVVKWLAGKGYTAPAGADRSLSEYAQLRALIAEVDPNRIELVGGERAQLSPIRFATAQAFDTLPSRLGLLNSPKQQELVVFVIDPEVRYEAKNYATAFPPTNVTLDFSVKERMGEFYNALYDLILQKKPRTFLSEFAWPADGCGQPCATEPLMIHELLSLGGDVFEKRVPEAELHPKPPELDKEQLKAFRETLKALKPKERLEREKTFKQERVTVAERQALLSRHKYIVSRLHYRYDAAALPQDPKVGPGAPAAGGVAQPKGKDGEASSEVKLGGENKLQTRYNHFHPWVPVIQCQDPNRYRWGKAPRDYRGLRKTWIADDLTRKSHTQIVPAKVVMSAIPELGLGSAATSSQPAPVASAPKLAEPAGGRCGCRAPGAFEMRSSVAVQTLLGVLLLLFRRRRIGRLGRPGIASWLRH
jgi:hypothetical protein